MIIQWNKFRVIVPPKVQVVDGLLSHAQAFLRQGDISTAETILAKAKGLAPGNTKVTQLENQVALPVEADDVQGADTV